MTTKVVVTNIGNNYKNVQVMLIDDTGIPLAEFNNIKILEPGDVEEFLLWKDHSLYIKEVDG